MIRRLRLADAQACRDVFVAAVKVGAAGRYTGDELADWVNDPAMPVGYGAWLNPHITFVADHSDIQGFMMLKASHYLNMAFVRPEVVGKGIADGLHVAMLAGAGALGLTRLHGLASRLAQSVFTRHSRRMAPEIRDTPGLDPNQGPDDTPLNRVMVLEV